MRLNGMPEQYRRWKSSRPVRKRPYRRVNWPLIIGTLLVIVMIIVSSVKF